MREITDQKVWDARVRENGGHPLQLWGWGEVKAGHGWRAVRYELSNAPWAGAQVLLRTLPKGIGTFAYVPRGPVGQWGQESIDELAGRMKRDHKAIVLSIEPDTEETLKLKGWKKAKNTVLLPKTLILDLRKSEEALLEDMAKKTRQYIRKSANEGVTVREVASESDLKHCLDIYKETAKRASFELHDDKYYYDIAELLGEHSRVFVAEYQSKIVAFLWLAVSDATAFELYGGVNDEGQTVRANYCLKWTAITALKEQGIVRYDMNGLLNDGVSGFKKSFASHENMLIGTLDKPLSPLYLAWSKGLPLAKKIVRTLKKR